MTIHKIFKVELLVCQIFFPDTLLNQPEYRSLGDQNFFDLLSTRYLGIFSVGTTLSKP